MNTRWFQHKVGIAAACAVACLAAVGCEKKADEQAAVEPIEPPVAKKAPTAKQKLDAAKAAKRDDKQAAPARPGAKPPVTAEQLARNPAAAAVPAAGAQAAQAVEAAPRPGALPSVAPAAGPGAPVAGQPTVVPPTPGAAPAAPAAAPIVPAPVDSAAAPGKPAPEPAAGARAAGVVPGAARGGPDPAPPTALPERPTPPGPDELPLDVTGYISSADLERVVGTKHKLRRADLPGIATSPRYNSLYYAPEKGDGFGVGVQVWRDENLAESRTRFNTMRNTWSNVAPTNKITDQGFRSYFGNLVSVVFADPRRPLIAAVSCSTKICDADMLIELSKRVAERLR